MQYSSQCGGDWISLFVCFPGELQLVTVRLVHANKHALSARCAREGSVFGY